MINTAIDYTVEKFLITNHPVMVTAIDVLELLNKNNRITIKGVGESCPATVSVANIITQNMLNGKTKTDKILVDSDVLDDGRLISTIEIVITKTNNQ
jgi:DNA-binding protein Alba